MRNVPSLLLLFLVPGAPVSAHADDRFGVSAGLTVSQSLLGASWSRDHHELNAGLKSLFFTSGGEYLLAPGLSWNRSWREEAFFTSLTWAPLYYRPAVAGGTASRPPAFGGGAPELREGWNPGEVYFGVGKTFHPGGGRWGLDVDANLYTPAGEGFLQAWFWRVGAGVTYETGGG